MGRDQSIQGSQAESETFQVPHSYKSKVLHAPALTVLVHRVGPVSSAWHMSLWLSTACRNAHCIDVPRMRIITVLHLMLHTWWNSNAGILSPYSMQKPNFQNPARSLAIMLRVPTQNMSTFHIPYYPPNFSQPSGITHNIISWKFQQNKNWNNAVLTLKVGKVVYGIPKIYQFYHIPSYPTNFSYSYIITPNIISWNFLWQKLSGTMPFWRSSFRESRIRDTRRG